MSCGLIKLRSYTIPVDKITAIEIDQPLVSRLLGRYNAKVVTVGLGDEEGESSNITLSLTAASSKTGSACWCPNTTLPLLTL